MGLICVPRKYFTMKCNIFMCFVFVFFSKALAINDNYNFTYSMASRCKEHIARRGYNYDTFYHIDEENLRHGTVKIDNTDITYFEMHIAIQAPSNGHILLSPVAKPGPADSVYEIVVGGGGNKFTELRLNLKRNARSSAKTPNILSTVEFTAFYIKVSDEGVVEFGKEGDSLPVLTYYDPHTLPIKYFSFASWAGVEAKFLFDCPTSDDDARTPDSQRVEPKLSNSEELKRNLLLSKLPSVAPGPVVTVQLSVKVTHLKYDALEYKLKTRMAVVMSWTDNGMAWSPLKFNGTSSLMFRQGQIWRPMFFVYNSDSSDPFDAQNPDMISVVYSGDATFHFQAEVTTWCMDSEETNKWPQDEYVCAVVIEPWEMHEKITIDLMDPNDNKVQVFTDVDKMIESEWEVTQSALVIKSSFWDQAYRSGDNDTHKNDRFVIHLVIKRSATTFNIAFYTPLLVLIVFFLISFWSEPLHPSRIWYYTVCTIVICMGLSNIDYLIPTHTIPSILVFYLTILGGVLFALVLQVFLESYLAKKLCDTSFMKGLLTFSLLRTVFCLPPSKVSSTGVYSRQEDVEDEVCIRGSEDEMDQEETSQGRTRELAEVIDKISFVVWSITVAFMLGDHF